MGNIAASGGGMSSVYKKPAWQTGPGVPNDGARDVPDVSLTASDAHDPYLIVSEGAVLWRGRHVGRSAFFRRNDRRAQSVPGAERGASEIRRGQHQPEAVQHGGGRHSPAFFTT